MGGDRGAERNGGSHAGVNKCGYYGRGAGGRGDHAGIGDKGQEDGGKRQRRQRVARIAHLDKRGGGAPLAAAGPSSPIARLYHRSFLYIHSTLSHRYSTCERTMSSMVTSRCGWEMRGHSGVNLSGT